MKRTVSLTALPLLLALALAAGCNGEKRSAPAQTGEPLAEVGDTVITVEEFETQLNRQSPFLRARYEDPEKKRELLDNMVRFELLAQEAEARGLDEDPDVREAMKKVMVQKLVRQQLEQEGAGEIPIEESKAWYQEHIDEYVKPERVRVAHVFFEAAEGDAAARKAARQEAEALRRSLEGRKGDPRAFQQAARENSDDAASRSVGGDLNYRTREELSEAWGEPLADAAFALENIGDISAVVESDKGFHVLKIVARQQPVDRSFDQVRRSVESRMSQERRRERYESFLEQLENKQTVKVYEDKLAAVEVQGAEAEEPHHGMMGRGRPARPAEAAGETEPGTEPGTETETEAPAQP